MLKWYMDLCLTPVYWNACFTQTMLGSISVPSQQKKIALIACVKQKKEGIHRASDLFSSAWFVKTKEYVEKADFDGYYILSAKYHLLSPSEEIKDYTEHLNQFKSEQIENWAQLTAQQIKEKKVDQDKLYIFGSGKYRSIANYLPHAHIEEPLKGMGISQQMSWMHQQSLRYASD